MNSNLKITDEFLSLSDIDWTQRDWRRFGDKLILKQLHARSGHKDEISRILIRQLTETAGWLDDLPEASI